MCLGLLMAEWKCFHTEGKSRESNMQFGNGTRPKRQTFLRKALESDKSETNRNLSFVS